MEQTMSAWRDMCLFLAPVAILLPVRIVLGMEAMIATAGTIIFLVALWSMVGRRK